MFLKYYFEIRKIDEYKRFSK